MTSTPASRSTRATTLAPRSCPSRPGLAMTTRMAPMIPPNGMRGEPACPTTHGTEHSEPGPRQAAVTGPPAHPVSELLNRRIAQHQVLHAVLAAEIDLRLG